jgi:DNA helicase-2/ATP-dependent DNA helicase PcrA
LVNQPEKRDDHLADAPGPFVSDKTKEQITKFVTIIHRHLGLIKKDTAGQILYYFLQDTGLLQRLASYKSTKEEKIAGNIAKIFNKLKTFEANKEDASVFAVVDWIDLSMNLGESPLAADTDWTENDAVNILTIHSSKGLEFPVVFLVNLVSNRFPSIERRDQIPIPDALVKEFLPQGDAHIQEERRLFYVGMTRARDLLYLTAAKFYGEGKRERKLSPFIVEALGEENVVKEIRSVQKTAKQLSFLEWEKAPELPTQQINQPITFLSYSQIDSFLTCPLQYKYRYIVKIPVPPSAALVFGDTIHKTLKAFYERNRAGEVRTKDVLFDLYEKHWKSVVIPDKYHRDRLKLHGHDLLNEFFDTAYSPDQIPEKLEETFKIRITPMLTLGGKIDRADRRADGTLEIIDYKTGQAPKSRNVGDDLQLTVYALAATQGSERQKPDNVIVSFYFLEGQQKFSATRTQEQLTQAKEKIADIAQNITTSDFRPTPGKHCDFCEFRLICEAWQ